MTRAKSNINADRLYSASADRRTGIIRDQTIALDDDYARQDYAERLRRLRLNDAGTGKALVFLTAHFELPALTAAVLYKSRRQVESFFKWIKHHMRIKRFYRTSENAAKTWIWIAVSAYVMVAIIKKRLRLEAPFYALMQVISVIIFEKLIQTTPSTEMSRFDIRIENNH